MRGLNFFDAPNGTWCGGVRGIGVSERVVREGGAGAGR